MSLFRATAVKLFSLINRYHIGILICLIILNAIFLFFVKDLYFLVAIVSIFIIFVLKILDWFLLKRDGGLVKLLINNADEFCIIGSILFLPVTLLIRQ
jgi:hypothetical protein